MEKVSKRVWKVERRFFIPILTGEEEKASEALESYHELKKVKTSAGN